MQNSRDLVWLTLALATHSGEANLSNRGVISSNELRCEDVSNSFKYFVVQVN